MICINCNYEIPDGVIFCPVCGRRLAADRAALPPAQPRMYGGYADKGSPRFVGFGEAIGLFFKNYVNFSGRSTRSEYWFAYLFVVLVYFACIAVDFVLPVDLFTPLAGIVFFLPMLAMTFRRFHDTGRTATMVWIPYVVSVVWYILLFAWLIAMIVWLFGGMGDASGEFFAVSTLFMGMMSLVPFGLEVYKILICCMPSQPEANKYGRAAIK